MPHPPIRNECVHPGGHPWACRYLQSRRPVPSREQDIMSSQLFCDGLLVHCDIDRSYPRKDLFLDGLDR